jgi:calcineurin-like phosphoesterase family protein
MSSTAEQTLFKYSAWQMLIEVEGRKVLLNHFPFLCYAGVYRDPKGLVYSLFGHVHSGPGKKGEDIPRLIHTFPTQYDVGVDNNDYEPISWYEVNEKIQKQLLKSKFKVKE